LEPQSYRLIPFADGFYIYLLPIVFLCVGGYFHAWRRWRGIPTLLGLSLIVIVLGGEVVRGWYRPFHKPQARLVMECIGRSQRSTDLFYLLPRTGSAFGFYRPRVGIDRHRIRYLSDKSKKGKAMISLSSRLAPVIAASSERLWVVGLHKPKSHFDQLESSPIVESRVARCRAEGSEAWLFDSAGSGSGK
jgi:hypothetical protein